MRRKLQSYLSSALQRRSGLLAIFFVAAAFHTISYYYVAAFYRSNLPHYDSMGSYTAMFEIMNLINAGGYSTAITLALENYLSWLQGFFAVVAAPIVSVSPQGVQGLNSFALLALMVSIYQAARSYGAGELKAYMLTLMVFLPDVFYDWWGGVIDMRRDFAFFSFLAATFFMYFALLWRQTRTNSLLVGLFAGLTVYSRDNAIFFLAVVMGPMLIFQLLLQWRQSGTSTLLSWLPALCVSTIMIAPWIAFNLNFALERRLNPFVMYGAGDSPWVSFSAHWTKPLALMFGRLGKFPSGIDGWQPLTELGQILGASTITGQLGAVGGVHATLPLTFLGIVVGSAALWQVKRANSLKFRLTQANGLRFIVASGGWALLSTYIVICYMVGLKPLDYSSSQIPFFPSLLFFFSLLFVFGLSINVEGRLSLVFKFVFAALATLLVLWLAVLRLEAKAPESTTKYVETARTLAKYFADERPNVKIAYLWHDTISYDTLTFYRTQHKENANFRKFLFLFNGYFLDFAVATPPGVKPEDMVSAARKQIEGQADYVVLSTDPGAYSVKGHHMFIFEHGQPIVDSLLKSDQFQRVLSFELWGQPFVVLKRLPQHGPKEQ